MRVIPLSKATKFVVDNRGRTAPTTETGIPLIATNCISNDRLYPAYEKLRFVSPETYQCWFRSHPLPGDIILTNKGSQNGAVCLVPDPVDFVIAQDMVALRADEDVIDPLYLFAALRSPSVQRQIKNLDVSGVIPHFKKTDFDKLHLPYPERDNQYLIGRLYFDLSAKIELNRRMSNTLEAMVHALFKGSFVDGVLGRAPKGWQTGKFEQFATLSHETINPGEYPDETFDHYSIPAFDDGRLPRPETGEQIKSNKFIVPSDAVMISKLNPRIPRVWFPKLSTARRSVSSTEFLIAIPKGDVSREYIYGFFNASEFLDIFATMVTGTSGSHQRVKADYLLGLDVAVPPAEEIVEYTVRVQPLLERIAHNLEESSTLTALRDALLPQLLSGEVRACPQY